MQSKSLSQHSDSVDKPPAFVDFSEEQHSLSIFPKRYVLICCEAPTALLNPPRGAMVPGPSLRKAHTADCECGQWSISCLVAVVLPVRVQSSTFRYSLPCLRVLAIDFGRRRILGESRLGRRFSSTGVRVFLHHYPPHVFGRYWGGQCEGTGCLKNRDNLLEQFCIYLCWP